MTEQVWIRPPEEWTVCVECGADFLREIRPGRNPLATICSNRCAVRRWRKRYPGRECTHGRVHTCRIHKQS